jgi:glycerol-3-phosphate dehydrogenase
MASRRLTGREPFYCVPWRDMHYFGPTETLYEGDIDDIRPLEEEISGLIDEANWLLPSLRLARDDVLFAWAGVRPLTYDPELPKGKRSREVHDLAPDGIPGIFAVTAGPIMTHRSAGAELTGIVTSRLRPSRNPQTLSYAAIAEEPERYLAYVARTYGMRVSAPAKAA